MTHPSSQCPAWVERLGAVAGLLLAGTCLAAPVTVIHELAPASKDLDLTASYRLNQTGQVVGYSALATQPAAPVFLSTAWAPTATGASAVELQSVQTPGTLRSVALAINDAGVIAGLVEGQLARWTPNPGGGWGAAQLLGKPAGVTNFSVLAIGDDGVIGGQYFKCANADCSQGNTRSWIYANGSYTEIGPVTGLSTEFRAMNDQGDALLDHTVQLNQTRIQVRKADGTLVEVLQSGTVNDLNNAGQIVGWRTGSVANSKTGFVREADGTERALTGFTQGLSFEPRSINNLGWVAGGDRHLNDLVATLWVGQKLWDLNGLLSAADAADWQLRFAMDINDAGWITGLGTYRGEERAFLMQLGDDFIASLDPQGVPEPGTAALLGAGLLCLASVRQRRYARLR